MTQEGSQFFFCVGEEKFRKLWKQKFSLEFPKIYWDQHFADTLNIETYNYFQIFTEKFTKSRLNRGFFRQVHNREWKVFPIFLSKSELFRGHAR